MAAQAQHAAKVVEPFLWGLVPDSELILQRWSERFHVSPRNVFQRGENAARSGTAASNASTPRSWQVRWR